MPKVERWVEVAKLEELQPGSKKRVVVDGEEILLANVNGTIYAVSDRCGHMNMSLAHGTLEGYVVECPLHGSQFDVRNGSIVRKQKDEIDQWFEKKGFPVIQSKPLRTYEIVLEWGSIKLKL